MDNNYFDGIIARMHLPVLDSWTQFAGKRVLMLQGPHGPFFQRVAKALLAAGACTVQKINFNGGDVLYYPSESVAYRGGLVGWPAFIDAFIQENSIDCVMAFGDCRPIHIDARAVAHARGVQYWVFEEGYIRPNFITLEQHGVNGFSCLPDTRDKYDTWSIIPIKDDAPVPPSFGLAAKYAMAYFTASTLTKPWFWRYQHHRNLHILDGLHWVRSYFRKIHYKSKEANVLDDLLPKGNGEYFLAVLQVASDAQVAVHSPYQSVAEFLLDTVRSFAHHGPSNAVLVVKHHPMDRGYSDYTALIDELTKTHRLAGRLRYIHDQHLPTLLSHAQGVVTINSTVGLSALFHGTPVITMGKAVYDMDGLTCQVGLEAFWRNPQAGKPDAQLHLKFRNYVTVHTQINGSFYVRLPHSDAAGVRWRTQTATSSP